MTQVILIDDNSADNVTHEALIRNWNSEVDISIIDNSEDVLRYLKREFSRTTEIKGKTAIFLDEIIPYLEGMGLTEYVERMRIEDDADIEVYFLTNNSSEILKIKVDMMPDVKMIHKPLTEANLNQIFA
ncbi:MAG: DNA-binding response OmpR family regulator [Crocinitomix sp.]|jgi:DNA-binding response OmpR family regulator